MGQLLLKPVLLIYIYTLILPFHSAGKSGTYKWGTWSMVWDFCVINLNEKFFEISCWSMGKGQTFLQVFVNDSIFCSGLFMVMLQQAQI